jgi:DNA-binding HxlR family transcriptional regulator
MTSNPPVWNVMLDTCPSRTSLARIANKWTAMIVIALSEGPARFGTVRQAVGGISGKVLGQTLREPLMALGLWAEQHIEEVLGARDAFDDRRADETGSTPESEKLPRRGF